MKKIKVGIVGYGNLGKAVEEIVLKTKDMDLIGIFSRRNIKAKSGKIFLYSQIEKFKNKIDLLFLCGGSSSNLISQSENLIKNFCTIDAFDTHKKIPGYIKQIHLSAKKYNKVAFCCFGWDPGLFSLMRVLIKSLGKQVYTIWGKGVSQGHTEAVKCVKNVQDAVQFTIPNKAIVKKIKNGKLKSLSNTKDLHYRLCYVCCEKKFNKKIDEKIKSMPYYFDGYKTIIKHISKDKLLKIKKSYHSGEVFSYKNEISFAVKMESNPIFTAEIMVTYSRVLYNYSKVKMFGAYSILDIPFSHLAKNTIKEI